MVVTLAWKIFAVAIAKKATLYALARTYGFPRVYRRFVEINRRSISDRTVQRSINNKVKYFFRLPNRIAYSFGIISQHQAIKKK